VYCCESDRGINWYITTVNVESMLVWGSDGSLKTLSCLVLRQCFHYFGLDLILRVIDLVLVLVPSLQLSVGLDRRSYCTLGPVSAWMGDCFRPGKLLRYITSHPGQLSLAILLWVGAMSTSLGWEGNHRSGVVLAMRHEQ